MEFNETTRKLTSGTGYIKRISTGEVFGDMWLGNGDSPDNYAEATREEYDEYVKNAYPDPARGLPDNTADDAEEMRDGD